MNIDALREGLSAELPPEGLPPALEALWWSAKGDWERAHKIVMGHEGEADADWVHAYLHRVEGDLPNARYWYAQAGRDPAGGAPDQEWSAIASALLVQKTGLQR